MYFLLEPVKEQPTTFALRQRAFAKVFNCHKINNVSQYIRENINVISIDNEVTGNIIGYIKINNITSFINDLMEHKKDLKYTTKKRYRYMLLGMFRMHGYNI